MLGFDFFTDQESVYYFAKDVIPKGEYPRVNIYKKCGEYKIIASLPGVIKNGIEVYYKDGYLFLRGEKKDPDNGKADFVKTERGFGSFIRALKIERKVDEHSINAEVKNGMLNITLRILPGSGAKRVDVK